MVLTIPRGAMPKARGHPSDEGKCSQVVADVRRLFFVSSDNHGRHASLVAASSLPSRSCEAAQSGVIRNQDGCLSLWTPHQVRGDANGERGRKLRGVVRLSQTCGGFFLRERFTSFCKTFYSKLAAKESLCGLPCRSLGVGRDPDGLDDAGAGAKGGAVWVPNHHDAPKRIARPERRRGGSLQQLLYQVAGVC